MPQIDYFDLIDKYLRNEMTPEESSAFEKTLAHNEELRKEVEIRYDIIVGIRASEQKHILDELEKIDHQKLKTSKLKETTKSSKIQSPKIDNNKKNIPKYSWWFILILVLGLIVILLFLMTK